MAEIWRYAVPLYNENSVFSPFHEKAYVEDVCYILAGVKGYRDKSDGSEVLFGSRGFRISHADSPVPEFARAVLEGFREGHSYIEDWLGDKLTLGLFPKSDIKVVGQSLGEDLHSSDVFGLFSMINIVTFPTFVKSGLCEKTCGVCK